MAKTLRLHTLAKELGIPSKAIIDKCAAEGIEIKNHMAVISLGLAESIKEWFSATADVTSVESAAPVDLEKIPKRRSKSTKLVAAGHDESHDEHVEHVEEKDHHAPEAMAADGARDDEGGESEIAVAVEEPPTRPEVHLTEQIDAPGVAVLPPSIVLERPAAREEPPPPPAPAPPRPGDLGVAARATPARTEPPVVEPPPKPVEPVRPAGPQLVPKPAELRGPRVVRIEAPEHVRAPRPRPLPGVPREPMVAGSPSTSTTTRRPAARGRGGRTSEEESEAAKRAARSPRRHGVQEVVEREREWTEQDVIERKERLASATGHGLRDRRAAEKRRQSTTTSPGGPAARKSTVEITAPIMLKDYCAAIGKPYTAILSKIVEHTGKMIPINQFINAETAEMIALDLGVALTVVQAKTGLERIEEEFALRERQNLRHRPPVVAMLGHVDHGKTSLLDAIRRTNVAAGEAGGITQHIGAYRIDRGDWHVTFLDTPGHEAFTAMRARGANLTDVVVLVVAADDGVMPQTIEAINHAKAAGVAIVVALNKIDLPNADVTRVYSQLSEQELVPSEWGGKTDVIKTSATSGKGIDELLAHLSILSELLDLKADPDVPAQGVVIEAQMREGQGIVAQVLVREGTLKTGQYVVCGAGAGKVRTLLDDRGRRIKEAGPGTPVEVVGLDELPEAGDRIYQMDDLARAKDTAAETRARRRDVALQSAAKPRSLEALLAAGDGAEVPSLNIILKADVQGSVESLRAKLAAQFASDKAKLNILHSGVGVVTEADVRLAQASGAIIIGFTVVADERARQLADQVGVEIRLYRIIYEVVDDLQKALEGLLEPVRREEVRGKVEVRQVFNVTRIGTIAGCAVIDGVVARSHKVRLVRDGRIILAGAPLESLKRFKDDAREVRAGFECGIKIQGFDDIKPGDVLETFEVVEVAQRL